MVVARSAPQGDAAVNAYLTLAKKTFVAHFGRLKASDI